MRALILTLELARMLFSSSRNGLTKSAIKHTKLNGVATLIINRLCEVIELAKVYTPFEVVQQIADGSTLTGYFEYKGNRMLSWAHIFKFDARFEMVVIAFKENYNSGVLFHMDYYGKTWRIWDNEPTSEESKEKYWITPTRKRGNA